MESNKENPNKLNYRIQLLAANNVVLVEANNYESEIFVPQIVNGRITFFNIIPNRRCCQNGGKLMKCTPNLLNDDTQPLFNVNKVPRVQQRVLPIPLANSTPAPGDKRDKFGLNVRSGSGSLLKTYSARENHSNVGCFSALTTPESMKSSMSHPQFNSYNRGIDSSLPTPEPARRAVPAQQQILNKSLIKIPKGIKLVRLYNNPMIGTPKKLGRLVATSSNASHHLANMSRLNESFAIPSNSLNSSRRNHNISILNPDSIAKWHKVMTPIRTYTRRCQQPLMISRPVKVSSAKKPYKPKKVVPTFLVNPTKGPNISHIVEMKKCRLIFDKKLCISPRTFKRQQLQPLSPAQNLPHRKSLAQKTHLQTSASYKSSLPKSRHQLETMQMSAFDLLTNSNRSLRINPKLNEQFRYGCVNKASSTYSKYKILSSVPPLQQDEQVLEISRISLATNSSNGHQSQQQIMVTPEFLKPFSVKDNRKEAHR